MRIRTIKPEFYLHEGLFELELETSLPIRLAFTGLWCVADREGRFKWEPRKIGVQVMPYDPIDFSRVLHALTTRGFIQKYEVDSVEYGWIPSFNRHQVINNRERDSDLPEPTEHNICDASTTREARVTTRDQSRKAEGKGREGNREGNGIEGKGSPAKAKGSVEEVKTFVDSLGLPESDAIATFHKWEGNGWTNSGKPIKDWKATIRAWMAQGFLPSQKDTKTHRKNEYPQETLQLPD